MSTVASLQVKIGADVSAASGAAPNPHGDQIMERQHLQGMLAALVQRGILPAKDRSRALAAMLNYWEDRIAVCWTVADVRTVAEGHDLQLSAEECRQVLQAALRHHDATRGINWDTLYVNLQVLGLADAAHEAPYPETGPTPDDVAD